METVLIEIPKREFCFKLAGSDEVFRLPLMGSLPLKSVNGMMKVMEAETAGEMMDRQIEIFDAICPGLTDVVTADQLMEVFRAWREASGINEGESRASSD